MDLRSLVLLSDVLIVEIVGVELRGMIVVIEELVVSVNLVCESAFLDGGNGTAPSLMSSTGVWQ